jgi:hypothetical protein
LEVVACAAGVGNEGVGIKRGRREGTAGVSIVATMELLLSLYAVRAAVPLSQ